MNINELEHIKWNIFYYGVLEGKCSLEDFPKLEIPDSDKSSGTFTYSTPFMAGGQKVTLTWDKDIKNKNVYFRVFEIKPPSV